MPTRHAFIEFSHGLVGRANLDSVEGGFSAWTSLLGAVDLGLLGVVPRSGSAKDVLTLLTLECTPRKNRSDDCGLIRASAAFETIPGARFEW